jgi:arylsulfatase A-like enzyme
MPNSVIRLATAATLYSWVVGSAPDANAESGPNGRLEGNPPGGPRSTVFEGQSWATLSNTPLRRYKHFNHEGGIATPLIVHWPSGVSSKGEFRQQVGHVIDIMATCVDVAGAKYPTEFNGKKILPMEGRSLIPAFADSRSSATPFTGSMKGMLPFASAIGSSSAWGAGAPGNFTTSKPTAPNCWPNGTPGPSEPTCCHIRRA